MLKVGAVQMVCSTGDWQGNLKVAAELLEQCRVQGGRLAVLPELFNTGYLMASLLAGVAEEAYDKTLKELTYLSSSMELYIVAGIAVPHEKGKPLNGVLLFTPEGRIKTGGKLHLCQMGYKEKDYVSPAAAPLLFELDGTKIGAIICYDIAFPETARILALEGCGIILAPTAWNVTERSHVYDLCTRARALENGVWVIAANQAGGPPEDPFLGRSRFVTPKGAVLAEMEKQQGVLMQDVDLELSQKLLARGETYPFLMDRVPGMYHRLCQE